MNFSSRHTVSQSIKRKTRFWRATSKAQDTNSKCCISTGYNMAKSKWLFQRPAEGKPSCLWNQDCIAQRREAHRTLNKYGGERCTKTSFPKSRSCEWVIRFQSTRNLKGTMFLSVLKKNKNSNKLINMLKVKCNAEINKMFCTATFVTYLESL